MAEPTDGARGPGEASVQGAVPASIALAIGIAGLALAAAFRAPASIVASWAAVLVVYAGTELLLLMLGRR